MVTYTHESVHTYIQTYITWYPYARHPNAARYFHAHLQAPPLSLLPNPTPATFPTSKVDFAGTELVSEASMGDSLRLWRPFLAHTTARRMLRWGVAANLLSLMRV
jgi:hypothetical protein